MRASTVQNMKKVKDFLWETSGYVPADVIAEKCRIAVSSVYRIIRLLRQERVGIHVTHKGYILSEVAERKDDTHLFRRLNGRRVSDILTMQAAAPHIRKRWRAVEDREKVRLILGGLEGNMKALTTGVEAICFLEEKHGL